MKAGLLPISAHNISHQTVWLIESLFLRISLYCFDKSYFKNMQKYAKVLRLEKEEN